MLVDQSAAASLAAECLGGVDAVDCIRALEGDSSVAAVAAVETEAEVRRRCEKTKQRAERVSLTRVYAENTFAGNTHFEVTALQYLQGVKKLESHGEP